MKSPISILPSIPAITLGMFIHDKRMEQKKSLRAFAEDVARVEGNGASISCSTLSEIENGRRSPSDRLLASIAKALGVHPDEMERYDDRLPTENMQRMMALNPQFGFVFRKAVAIINEQDLSPQQLLDRLCAPPNNNER